MTSPAAAAPHQRDGHSVGFNLTVIGIAAALAGVGLAYLINAAGHDAHVATAAVSPQAVARTLGSTDLHIPTSWLATTSDDNSAGGFAKQVDLAVTLPLGPDGAPRRIEMSLTQRSRVRPSSSLLDGVYLHRFMADQLPGPVGLVGKPLVADEGFENETVWYDPLHSSPFVAKCSSPVVDSKPGRCLRTVYLGPGIAVVYSFDADVLGNWQQFDAQLQPLLTSIGAL